MNPLLLFVLLAGLPSAASADVLRGTVKSQSGAPLVGVSVYDKTSGQGVVTDEKGQYAIDTENGHELRFSYLGFQEQHHQVNGSQLDVKLKDDVHNLDELVVVGYGVQKKRDIIGAVSSVSGDVLENRSNPNITRSLQGQVPGLTITMADGKVSRAGKEVAYREEDYGNISRKHDWVVDSETRAYKLHKNENSVTLVSSDVTKASSPKHIKVETLMPGALGTYCASFRIPENWHGDKTMRLKVTAVSVESNVMAAVANASGLSANGESESVTLNYLLNRKTDKLELQVPAQPNDAVANAIASGLYANEIDAMDTDVMLDVHDIELKHRIYDGPGGERLVDITVRNYAATRETLKLSCAVYVDGANEAEYLNLPLYEKSTSNRRAQTITIPVNALVDDISKHAYARVEVSVVGVDENAYANNEFDVVFSGDELLRFTRQPEDEVVQEGEDVSFEVEVGGGSQPYTYQWQVWDPVHKKWVDLKGFTEPTLRREDIEKKWDGCVFRCVVTDAEGTQIISETVTLTVRLRVDTGDHTNLPLYQIVAMVAIILLIALRRRREIR